MINMVGLRYVAWTEKEDNILKDVYEHLLRNYKPNQNKGNIISYHLKVKGFNRSAKGCLRRLFRLGLSFYDMDNSKVVLMACTDCEQQIVVKARYYNRKLYPVTRCPQCQYKHDKGYNLRPENHNNCLEYYKEWRKFNKSIVEKGKV
jgi:DNA-directed RNA polymerase subunit RPC12/RpoP